MKKRLTFYLIFCLMVSLTACGGSSDKNTSYEEANDINVLKTTIESTSEYTTEQAEKTNTMLLIKNIEEGEYKGILSGCSFSTDDDNDIYSIEQNISQAEISVTVKNGKVELYCEADVSADGTVLSTYLSQLY